MAMVDSLTHASTMLQLIAEQAATQRTWIVGGTVRDMLLARSFHDIDLVIDGSAHELATQVADLTQASMVSLDQERDIARVVVNPHSYFDIARMRGKTIETDLKLRDLTINALAIPLTTNGQLGEIIDPLNGVADLNQQRLRLCSPHSIMQDPLRMMRIVRFASNLGWEINQDIHEVILQSAPLIEGIAKERIQQELLAILAQNCSAPILRYLQQADILFRIIPELEVTKDHDQPGHVFPVWEHLLEAVSCGDWLIQQLEQYTQGMPPTLPSQANQPWPPAFFNSPSAVYVHPSMRLELTWIDQVRRHMRTPVGHIARPALWKLAILLHDIAKPATREDHANGRTTFHEHQIVGATMARAVCKGLKLGREAQNYIQTIVRAHMRPGQLNEQGETSERAAYRFFRDLEPAAVDTLLHSLIDHLATRAQFTTLEGWAAHQAWIDAMLGFYWQKRDLPAKPLIDGYILMKTLNMKPGPQIGVLLEGIHEAWEHGEISTEEEALHLAQQIKARL